MTPAMIAALKDKSYLKTIFMRIQLPDATRYMMMGSGQALWGSQKYVSRDPTFGHVDSIGDISESNESVAPNSSFTLIASKTAVKGTIAASTVQLSPVTIWLAALTLDGSNHVIAVSDPEELFDGFIDQATINQDANQDEIDYTLISGFDFFFEDGEGQRLNGAFHQTVWSGENGLNNVNAVTKKVYWGQTPPPTTNTTNSSIYGGGYSPITKSGISSVSRV